MPGFPGGSARRPVPRASLRYVARKFDERWTARLGAVWDQTPIPTSTLDFQLPDVNRIALAAGFGAQISQTLRADLGGLYVMPGKRSTSMAEPLEPPVKGSFQIDALVVGLTVGIQLDVPEAPPLEQGNDLRASSD